MLERLRGVVTRTIMPLASFLLRIGVSPDAVTITGTLVVASAALSLFPTGHLLPGALVIIAFALTDLLDGTMARASGRSGPWGAFLDSTLDRIADGAIFAGLTVYFVRGTSFGLGPDLALWGAVAAVSCLGLGSVVPYARARAEGLGMTAKVGIAERADRLFVALGATLAVGVGAPPQVLVVVLVMLALASTVTIAQRMSTVRRQCVAAAREAS